MTNAERIRSMNDEEIADLLAEISYSGTGPWEWPFERLFCETCPAPEYTLDDGRKLNLHECDFEGCECPHGRGIVWWLGQPEPAGMEAPANGRNNPERRWAVMEGLTPKEADAWASEMTRIVCDTIHELIAAADKHNIDCDSAVQYYSDLFSAMTSVATFAAPCAGAATDEED